MPENPKTPAQYRARNPLASTVEQILVDTYEKLSEGSGMAIIKTLVTQAVTPINLQTTIDTIHSEAVTSQRIIADIKPIVTGTNYMVITNYYKY